MILAIALYLAPMILMILTYTHIALVLWMQEIPGDSIQGKERESFSWMLVTPFKVRRGSLFLDAGDSFQGKERDLFWTWVTSFKVRGEFLSGFWK